MSDIVVEVVRKGEPKKFYCDTRDICAFKNHYSNSRCFAPYSCRSTCRYVATDQKRINELSREIVSWSK